MPEDEKTAETTEQVSGVDENAVIDENKSESINELEFTDSKEEEHSPSTPKESKTQSKEQNSENARRRREAERQAELEKARIEAREKAIIEILNGKNPYTNEEIKDHADVEEYLTMKEIEKNGGDPLADYSKYHKQKERERESQRARESQEQEWYRNDYEEFLTKHPDVKLEDLIRNEQFQKFASGKVGNLPLSQIYEGFIEVVSEYEKKAKQIAKQILANAKSTPGPLSNPSSDGGFFTREQVKSMSQEEVHKNFDKIRESMKKW